MAVKGSNINIDDLLEHIFREGLNFAKGYEFVLTKKKISYPTYVKHRKAYETIGRALRKKTLGKTQTDLVNQLKNKFNVDDAFNRTGILAEEIKDLKDKRDGKVKFHFQLNGMLLPSHDDQENFRAPIEVLLKIDSQIAAKEDEISRLLGRYAPTKTETPLEDIIIELI